MITKQQALEAMVWLDPCLQECKPEQVRYELVRAHIEAQATRIAELEARHAEPAGFVRVPVEPTEGMLNAAYKEETKHVIWCRRNGSDDTQLGFRAAYRAMIAAAPKEPT